MTVELNLLEDISVVPLRDMVVFPHGVQPLFVGTPRSIAALEFAMAGNKQVFLVTKIALPDLGDANPMSPEDGTL